MMAQHRAPAPLRIRVGRAVAVALAGAGAVGLLIAGPASAAPKGNANGFLVLTVDGVTTTLPPGKAVKAAAAACVGRAGAVAVDVAAVRAAFPAPVAVCTGVTLTSRVAAEAAAK